jgi:hypothetical protein
MDISNVFIEEDGIFVRQAEIKDPLEGSHLKIKLSSGVVIVRVLNRRPGVAPSFEMRFLSSGARLGGRSSKARLVVWMPPFVNGETNGAVPFLVTWSFALCVSFRVKAIVGDLAEEYAQKRLSLGKSTARIWLSKQILGSIGQAIWQILRYDLRTGLNGWRVWGLAHVGMNVVKGGCK